jgi:hypothetical protein
MPTRQETQEAVMTREYSVITTSLLVACVWVPSIAAQQTVDAPGISVQARACVVVGEDGNGVVAATFPTTIAGEDVHYQLLVTNGCSDEGTPGLSVDTLQATLNGDVVLQRVGDSRQTVSVDLEPVSGPVNQLVVTASGPAGARASVLVAALSSATPIGGRSVLPWAWTDSLTRTVLTIHNAGPSKMSYRLTLLLGNGSEVGRTPSETLEGSATAQLDLVAIATRLGIDWKQGPVHVDWAARGTARMSAVVSQVQRQGAEARVSRELALDDYGPLPITMRAFEAIAGVR